MSLQAAVPAVARGDAGRHDVSAATVPVTTHPRLWITQDDLPRLRAWATAGNPLYQQGLKPLAATYKSKMDNGSLFADDCGCTYSVSTYYPVEWGAELFAFMSLIENDPAVRQDYAGRARQLLMYIMNKAVLGPTDADSQYRGRVFSTNMRALFYGEAFPLTVDWIYPTLSAQDKATIRAVFLRWQRENLTATTSGLDHPEPVWVLNDPVLLSERSQYRWAGNNFFIAHMNQIGLMALALDAADDPGDPAVKDDQVRDFLPNAIGAWLYMHHHFSEDLAAGGVPPEGLAYGPTGIGRAGEFLLALYTAGEADTSRWGPQVSFDTPFWNSIVPALLHTASPEPTVLESWKGPAYLIADHGDTYDIYSNVLMTLLGTRGLYAQYTGDVEQLERIRWIARNMAPGGAAKLTSRSGDFNYLRDCILHFLLFDPAAPPPSDPRPSFPLGYFAAGTGRLLARTAWSGPVARWFTYMLGWHSIDHQHATGNMIEFWRKGEWLTKQWSGYGEIVANSDYKNTLALQNTPATSGFSSWARNNQHGSQYVYGPGDSRVLAHSLGDGYTYALGDATGLYNNARIGATDITEATRSVVWLQPDVIVVYDRAASSTSGRFKRFWLNLPTTPTIAGSRATTRTQGGQQLVVDALLPAAASLGIDAQVPNGNGYNETANYEPMTSRLVIEAPGGPASTRFLTVLHGLDPGESAPVPALVQSTEGTPLVGAVVGNTAVLFPVDVGHVGADAPFDGVGLSHATYVVPASVTSHIVTGLAANAGYTVDVRASGGSVQITVAPGGASTCTDSGGVLVIGPGALPCGGGDDDGDGLTNEWERRFGLDPGSAVGPDGPAGDPDDDDVTNLAEFENGTDPTLSNRWILAEGATGFFDERIAIANPGDVRAEFDVTFLREGVEPAVRSFALAPRRRMTLDVNETFERSAVSAVIDVTKGGIVAERTMRWQAAEGAGYGAHTGKATPKARTQWYLAEGEASFFDTWILLANAGTTPADVTATFLLDTGGTVTRQYVAAPESRLTIHANEVPGLAGHAFSTQITSTTPITVERAMYFGGAGQRFWEGGHESPAAEAPATTWFVAEGRTGPFFDMYLLLANPGDEAATVTIRFLTPAGSPVEQQRVLPPTSRTTIRVDGVPGLADTDVSAAITADAPILVERAMYWPDPVGSWYEAHASVGVTGSGTRWALAEGEVGGPDACQTYVLVANPGDAAATVTLTFLPTEGTPVTLTRAVPASGRLTVSAAEASLASGQRFGVRVDSTRPVVVERTMYWNSGRQLWGAGTSETGVRLR